MPDSITLNFNSGAAGDLTGYTDTTNGFVLVADSNPENDPNGLKPFTHVVVGGQGYLANNVSTDSVTVKSTAGKTFGVGGISLDGSNATFSPATGYVTNPAVVVFHFVGVRIDSSLTDEVTFTTDGTVGFQTFSFDAASLAASQHITLAQAQVLAAEFSAGLVELRWSVTDGSNPWGAFDNLILKPNHAPIATGIVGSTTTLADGTITGHLGGTDADGQTVTFDEYGALPAGVAIDEDGTFYVQRLPSDDNLLPGQSRTVTFSYVATDGAEDSAPKQVSFTISAAPQGADLRGGNHPQAICGTDAGERIYGGNQNDTLCGMGGADTLSGDNGSDSLMGGEGRDLLLGGNGSDWLEGGNGNDSLNAGNSPDKLFGGAGDDTLTGGQSPDEFYFGPGWGHDVITDFDPKNEHIHFTPSPTLGSWTDFQSLVANHHISQQGANVVIDDMAGNTLVLQNVKLSSLTEGDFIFG